MKSGHYAVPSSLYHNNSKFLELVNTQYSFDAKGVSNV